MNQFVTRILTDLSRCKTTADYYRVQIAINKHATPNDVAILSNRPLKWSIEFDAWLNKLTADTASIRKEPVQYQLNEVDRTTSLYAGASRAPDLVVAFCGKSGLLFMPVAMILQYFSPARFDVLVVREPFAKSGSGISFRDSIDKLSAAVGMTRYRDVRTFGASAGGSAALAAGILTGAVHAVSFGGHLPSKGIGYQGAPAIVEIEEILRGARVSGEFGCVYAADNEFDRLNAMVMSSLLPLRHFPIAGVDEHNIVFALHQRKELAKVFADVGLA